MPKKKRRVPRRILVIDIGGSHVKFRVGAVQSGPVKQGSARTGRAQKMRGAQADPGQSDPAHSDAGHVDAGRVDPGSELVRFASGPKLTAKAMARKVRELMHDTPYDAVSIGYPGLVIHGRIAAEPYNLGKGWVGFDFGSAFGKPVRLINDAAMQAIGSYEGGRMLFLGLGTGLGAALILDNVVEPMEIGHLPYRDGKSFEDFLGERGRKRLGNHKWRKTVAEVLEQLRNVLEVDYVVLGGGNARRMKKLPPHTRLGDNSNAFAGGLRLWDESGLHS